VVEGQAARLARFGVELARLGPESVAVRSLPYLLREMDAAPLVPALLGLLDAAATDTELLECLASHARLPVPLEASEREGLVREALALPEGQERGQWVCRRLDEAALSAWFQQR